jgi:phosphoribosylamine--glycine ligase
MIIGSGAREHAISVAYEKSKRVDKIVVAPGNDFISFRRNKDVICDNQCSLSDIDSILKMAYRHKPDFIDVAQDRAISIGAVNRLTAEGFFVFGPSKDASRIEWDKEWSRQFMEKNGIPHPCYKSFVSREPAISYAIKRIGQAKLANSVYIKASGLCEGKGALKSETIKEVVENIDNMQNFGIAGSTFVVEDGLNGEEFSYYAICNGLNFKTFQSAQDNKTIYSSDRGKQTGGMGANSPCLITSGLEREIENKFISPALKGLVENGTPFTGILYLGGIVCSDGIYCIEYNARWGDPECQVILPFIENDYFDIVSHLSIPPSTKKEIPEIKSSNGVRLCVVGSALGYPESYSDASHKRIYGLEELIEAGDVYVFGAGIKEEYGHFYTYGGRLFNIVAEGKNILEAKEKAYNAMSRINIEGNNLHYRIDIGWRDVQRMFTKQ